jgi:hypothetical protein
VSQAKTEKEKKKLMNVNKVVETPQGTVKFEGELLIKQRPIRHQDGANGVASRQVNIKD